MGKLNKYNIVGYLLFFIAGLSLGWFLFHKPGELTAQDDSMEQEESKSTVWTSTLR